MLQEKVAKGWSGWVMVGVLLAALAGSIVVLASSSDVQETAWLVAAVVVVLALDGVGWFGFTVVHAEHRARRAALRQLPGLDQDAGLLVGESADDAPDASRSRCATSKAAS